MIRAMGLLYAGVLLFAVTGCSLDSFSLAFTGKAKPDHVMAGSPEVVSLSIQSALDKAGLMAMPNTNGEKIVLNVFTRQHQQFLLILTKNKTEKGDSTAIQADWCGKEPDNNFFLGLMASAAACQAEQQILRPGLSPGMPPNEQPVIHQTSYQNGLK